MRINKKTLKIIDKFKLSPHPEGGWYKEVVRSKNYIKRFDGKQRNYITSILYLLNKGDKSAWHRVNGADEIWIYLRGSPLYLWCVDSEDTIIEEFKIDANNPIQIVPSGYWQAAKSSGDFTLSSCCVGPGFDFKDLQFLRDLPFSKRPNKVITELI